MSYTRVNIDLAFKHPLSSTVSTRLDALRAEIARARAYAVKINEGAVNEEMTVKGSWHICHHDTGGQPCEEEHEI